MTSVLREGAYQHRPPAYDDLEAQGFESGTQLMENNKRNVHVMEVSDIH